MCVLTPPPLSRVCADRKPDPHHINPTSLLFLLLRRTGLLVWTATNEASLYSLPGQDVHIVHCMCLVNCRIKDTCIVSNVNATDLSLVERLSSLRGSKCIVENVLGLLVTQGNNICPCYIGENGRCENTKVFSRYFYLFHRISPLVFHKSRVMHECYEYVCLSNK